MTALRSDVDFITLAERLENQAEFHLNRWKELRSEAAELRLDATAQERHVSLPTRPSEPPSPRRPRNYEAIVRDIAYELTKANGLDTFTVQDVLDAEPMSYMTALKWLHTWTQRGMLEAIQDGRTYHFARRVHASTPVNRPKAEAPEAGVVRAFKRSQVSGTGRRSQALPTNPHARQLALAAIEAGAEVKKTRGNHYRVLKDGVTVGGIAGTPSDHRGVLNERANLRRAGLDV